MKHLKYCLVSLLLATVMLTVPSYTTLADDSSTETDTSTDVFPSPMYRVYNPNSGEHFYTGAIKEKNYLVGLGWRDEGIGWYAPDKQHGAPVYRLYNKNGGEHHYTAHLYERQALMEAGWKYEGVGWYSYEDVGSLSFPLVLQRNPYNNAVSVYRQYNPNAFANNHNYTTNVGEKNYLISLGWNDEGISWYGVNKEEKEEEEQKNETIELSGNLGVSLPEIVKRYPEGKQATDAAAAGWAIENRKVVFWGNGAQYDITDDVNLASGVDVDVKGYSLYGVTVGMSVDQCVNKIAQAGFTHYTYAIDSREVGWTYGTEYRVYEDGKGSSFSFRIDPETQTVYNLSVDNSFYDIYDERDPLGDKYTDVDVFNYLGKDLDSTNLGIKYEDGYDFTYAYAGVRYLIENNKITWIIVGNNAVSKLSGVTLYMDEDEADDILKTNGFNLIKEDYPYSSASYVKRKLYENASGNRIALLIFEGNVARMEAGTESTGTIVNYYGVMVRTDPYSRIMGDGAILVSMRTR